jgi:hypothetical protein
MNRIFWHRRFILGVFFCFLFTGMSSGESNQAYIVTVDGMDLREMLIELLTPLEIPSGPPSNYLEPALENMNLGLDSTHIVSFPWNNDAGETNYWIGECREFLREYYQRAVAEDSQLIVVSHSWGTFLTYMALAHETMAAEPIVCDLYVTLSSPLGTFFARDGDDLYAEEMLVLDYDLAWLTYLGFFNRNDFFPRVPRVVNFWAYGDVISGPLGDFWPWAENIRVDVLQNPICSGFETRNIFSTKDVWHYYTSLQSGGAEDNEPLKTDIRNLILDTLGVEYPLVQVLLNGSSDSITVEQGQQFNAEFSLDPRTREGEMGDRWFGIWVYDEILKEWRVIVENCYPYTLHYFNMSTVIDTTTYAAGQYKLSFGIDLVNNQQHDPDAEYFDSVPFKVVNPSIPVSGGYQE